jgi:hypothetical protein
MSECVEASPVDQAARDLVRWASHVDMVERLNRGEAASPFCLDFGTGCGPTPEELYGVVDRIVTAAKDVLKASVKEDDMEAPPFERAVAYMVNYAVQLAIGGLVRDGGVTDGVIGRLGTKAKRAIFAKSEDAMMRHVTAAVRLRPELRLVDGKSKDAIQGRRAL